MKTYKDFSLITPFTTYINNQKWIFSFLNNKIIANVDNDYLIYNSHSLIYDTINYDTYFECFTSILDEINELYFCKICKKYDKHDCNICKLNEIIDKLPIKDKKECIVCYNDLTVRHISICNNDEHSLCINCYEKIHYLNNICPYCRQSSNNDNNLNTNDIID